MRPETTPPAALTLLDGPMGTELTRRGVDTRLPRWSATALIDAPEGVSAIHHDYAVAGAQVHTTNTFRTRERTMGSDWAKLARKAVQLARDAIPPEHRVAGSIAPLRDCYRPDLSPQDSRDEHRALCEVLAAEGCDILLVETFPLAREAWVATEEATQTGLETWVSFTAGPHGDLLTPDALRDAAQGAADRGASAVMINCTSSPLIVPYLDALATVGVAYGAYGNAGSVDDEIGWSSDASFGAMRYADFVEHWTKHGATLVGGCCGTGPSHIRAVRERIRL